jgi:hypothetical protein
MTPEQQKLTIEYKLGRSEMKDEIQRLIHEMEKATSVCEDDGSEFSKNTQAIGATLRSISTVISKTVEV